MTTSKPSASILKILRAISAGVSWRCSADTIERALAGGWIVRNADFSGLPYSLTRAGEGAISVPSNRDLEERFDRAVALNRRQVRENHEANLIKMPRSSGYKIPLS